MSSLNTLLETGSRSLLAYQLALETTGHNVANVDTPGYTRQRVELIPTPTLDTIEAQLGTGVKAGQITRLRQSSLDLQIRAQTSERGLWDAKLGALRSAEAVVGDYEGGLNTALSSFFASWQDLSTGPEDMALRSVVASRGSVLASELNAASSGLDGVHDVLDARLESLVADVNRRASDIAALNRDIFRGELAGQTANDLRDRRDNALDELSELVSVSWTEGADGRIDVMIGGDTLIQGDTTFSMSAVAGADGWLVAQWDAGGAVASASGAIAGIEAAHVDVALAGTRLDELAAGLISSVNTLHSAGTDLYGNPAGDFFQGTDAATIALDPALSTDPARVAAGATASPGDNSVALGIAVLADAQTIPSGSPNATFQEHFARLLTEIGESAREAADREDALTVSLTALEDWRSSISGVSVEEEMVDLMRYQRSYQAAARVITLADELLEMIVNRLGTGGR